MKKVGSLACAGVMFVGMFAGFTACGDKQVELTMEQLYNANSTQAVRGDGKTGIVRTNAITGEVLSTYLDGEVYYEMRVDTGELPSSEDDVVTAECYDKAGTVGYVWENGTYYSLLTSEENVKSKPNRAYTNQIFTDKTLALAEEIVSAVKKKDGVYVTTKHNAQNSLTVAQADGLETESGAYIQTHYVLDKDSYRVLSFERKHVKADGNAPTYFKLEQKTGVKLTDYDESLTKLYVKVQAVKDRQNVRQMTVFMDMHEANWSFCEAYAVKGDEFKIDLGKRYTHFYTDQTYTAEYGYPAEDTQKETVKLYTKREFIPAECDFTMFDVRRANDTRLLLRLYDSVAVKTSWGQSETKMFADDKMLYVDEGDGGRTYLADGGRGYKKSGDRYYAIVADGVAMKTYVDGRYANLAFAADWTDKEEIENVTETDGKLEITTRLEIAEDEYSTVVYLVDKNTFLLHRYQMEVDGVTYTAELTVDATAPAEANEMYAKLTAENVYTVAVLVNPAMADAVLCKGYVADGDGFECAYTLYTDTACTEAYAGGAVTENVLLYAKTE